MALSCSLPVFPFLFTNSIFSGKLLQEKLSTIGKIISSNSTASLAFDNPADGTEILAALKTEPHIVAACLYDKDGKLFSRFPAEANKNNFPEKPEQQDTALSVVTSKVLNQ